MTTTHPALFKPEMVRAILADRKTQTRRLASNRNFARVRPGDKLWVRETWQELKINDFTVVAYRANCEGNEFDFVGPDGTVRGIRVNKWRPSIFMPRKYCRLQLRVNDVRVEPLQDISDDDALAEGMDPGDFGARFAFAGGWDVINDKPGIWWVNNPEVRVIMFHRIIEEA